MKGSPSNFTLHSRKREMPLRELPHQLWQAATEPELNDI
jgi:hypothetical protein